MNDRLMKSLIFLSLVASTMLITGCGAKSYEKQQFLLDARRAPATTADSQKNVVEVRRFTIDPAFSAKGLTYRKGEFEYESDFYNEFLITPDAMITEKVRNWLSLSGLAQRVLNPGSYVDPDYVLEGNVIALYGDFRTGSAPKAVMEIRVFLLEMKTGAEAAIVFGKTYGSSVGVESEGPEGLVEALNRCLVEILSDLEKDLAERLR
ncbi:MAG: membrane integrity-associated transporter subunit PqiC [Phycisphaerales bacterium]|nr:MAG: membrane integrity-associated transporter subunit PqiC [Phycisphaerales bacterium]